MLIFFENAAFSILNEDDTFMSVYSIRAGLNLKMCLQGVSPLSVIYKTWNMQIWEITQQN